MSLPRRNPAVRDAIGVTVLFVGAIFTGSRFGRDLDAALFGYLGALLIAAFAIAYRASAFWRRPASAFYARRFVAALRQPRQVMAVIHRAADDLGAQRFIARRSRLRWAAHMSLSLGTLASFAITVPLVCGWLHFEADGQSYYRPVAFGLALPGFDINGVLGWFTFHALALSAVAVVFGAVTLLALRVRGRAVPGTLSMQHVAPLALLLLVALSGLALPASRGSANLFALAAALHELSVVILLVALGASKLSHVLIRPLQIGVRLVRTPGVEQRVCEGCGEVLAPSAQLVAVEALLAARGSHFAGHQGHCPACRRRMVAAVQAGLTAAGFHRNRFINAPSSARKAA